MAPFAAVLNGQSGHRCLSSYITQTPRAKRSLIFHDQAHGEAMSRYGYPASSEEPDGETQTLPSVLDDLFSDRR